MPTAPAQSAAPLPYARFSTASGALLIIVLVAFAYVPSFRGVFVFDDHYSIVENPTLRDWSQVGRILWPGAEAGTVAGRPVANLSFAVNYALSGFEPWSYHLVNLLIHVTAALALAGLVHRTLQRPPWAQHFRGHAGPLAVVTALLWALHPLQTESVTYVVQRVESLVGLLYLLTLYTFVRGAASLHPARWYAIAVLFCLLGMGTKEVMVTAPLSVLLYDRVFLSSSWSEVWRRRRVVHLALFSTWLFLAVLVVSAEGRGGSAGFGTTVSPWHYALTQCEAILHYLRLTVWPHPLVFDYGTGVVRDPSAVAAPALGLLALLGATAWALGRKPALGFLGAWFFLLLAPTSSIVPIATQTMAEHRMYLPLAAVVLGLVLVVHRLTHGRLLPFVPLVLLSTALTAQRNTVYASEIALWSDTVSQRPGNPRAQTNLGLALLEAGRTSEAVAHFRESLRLQPDHAATHLNLSAALAQSGQPDAALLHAETALRLEPTSVPARINAGNAHLQLRQYAPAIAHYRAAVQANPDDVTTHYSLAAALVESGDAAGALPHYETVVRLNPTHADAWLALTRLHAGRGDLPAARRTAEQAHRLLPGSPEIPSLLGTLAAQRGEFAAAGEHFQQAVALAPSSVGLRTNLANALLLAGRIDDAIAEYEAALRLQPGNASVQENLTLARQMQRQAGPR